MSRRGADGTIDVEREISALSPDEEDLHALVAYYYHQGIPLVGTTSDSPTEVRLLTYDEVRAEYLELEQEDDIIAIIPVIAGPLPPDDSETATGEQQSEATNGNTGEVNENLNSEQQVNQSNANNNTQAPTGENRIIWSVSVRDFEESDILYVGPQYVPHAQLEEIDSLGPSTNRPIFRPRQLLRSQSMEW